MALWAYILWPSLVLIGQYLQMQDGTDWSIFADARV